MTVLTDLVPAIAGLVEQNADTALVWAKKLRAANMVSRGVRGPGRGAQMTPHDAVNVLLGCILDHRYGVNVVEIVPIYRNLEFNSQSIRLISVDGLTCWGARTAGEALEKLIDDYRTGRVADWADGEQIDIKVTIDLRRYAIFIVLTKPNRDVTRGALAVADYAETGYLQSPMPVKRTMEINGSVFETIATALGSPHKS